MKDDEKFKKQIKSRYAKAQRNQHLSEYMKAEIGFDVLEREEWDEPKARSVLALFLGVAPATAGHMVRMGRALQEIPAQEDWLKIGWRGIDQMMRAGNTAGLQTAKQLAEEKGRQLEKGDLVDHGLIPKPKATPKPQQKLKAKAKAKPEQQLADELAKVRKELTSERRLRTNAEKREQKLAHDLAKVRKALKKEQGLREKAEQELTEAKQKLAAILTAVGKVA